MIGCLVALSLDPEALSRLRRTLVERAEAPPPVRRAQGSILPGAGSTAAEALVRRVAPFCELLYLMMVADGECDLGERAVLCGVVRALSGDRLGSRDLDAMIDDFEQRRLQQGAQSRLEVLAARLGEDRVNAEAAFTLAAVMAVADRQVDDSETDLLQEIAELLGISDARARELVAEGATSA